MNIIYIGYITYKMERKLVKQGRNALTVTLPANWLKGNSLSERDCVYIEESNGNLLIKSSGVLEEKDVEVDVRDMNKRNIYHTITDKYIQGYDVIKVNHNNMEEIKKVSANYAGMIIENLDEKECTLKNIIAKPTDNYHNIIKRITQLLVELSKKQIAYSKTGVEGRDVKRDDALLDNTILYAMRYISKYELESKRDKQKSLLVLYSIETMGDLIKDISEKIYKEEKVARRIYNLVEEYVKSVHLNDYKRVYNYIKKEAKGLKKESYVDGLYFSLTEVASNFIGYIIEEN